MFEATPLNVKNRRIEAAVRMVFGAMTWALIVPVVLILGVLVVRGAR